MLLIFGPLFADVDKRVRLAVEAIKNRREGLLIMLTTNGGLVEIAERIVKTVRHHYDRVRFIIPDRAMSAGTILAMSGDAILMDYYSCLGPIDPQVPNADGNYVPALSYLEQYERLRQLSLNGQLTTVDAQMMQKMDLAELHRYELQRDLSVKLIQDWLVAYKLRDWNTTEGRGTTVTHQMKEQRAKDIAEQLSDHKRWGSHGRGITMEVLWNDLGLKIDDFGADQTLSDRARDYHDFLLDYIMGPDRSFVHSNSWGTR
ncbi:MAG: SDH family Clp fold serine proteinase [Planctomycetota bacterium]